MLCMSLRRLTTNEANTIYIYISMYIYINMSLHRLSKNVLHEPAEAEQKCLA